MLDMMGHVSAACFGGSEAQHAEAIRGIQRGSRVTQESPKSLKGMR